jgi:hypothetical protein
VLSDVLLSERNVESVSVHRLPACVIVHRLSATLFVPNCSATVFLLFVLQCSAKNGRTRKCPRLSRLVRTGVARRARATWN